MTENKMESLMSTKTAASCPDTSVLVMLGTSGKETLWMMRKATHLDDVCRVGPP